ncbi:hypothetical protein [Geminocystis herdmanii]|nr:hypothetical protein [Geminocystis herdmanii]
MLDLTTATMPKEPRLYKLVVQMWKEQALEEGIQKGLEEGIQIIVI